jgi:hypothetical protein
MEIPSVPTLVSSLNFAIVLGGAGLRVGVLLHPLKIRLEQIAAKPPTKVRRAKS